MFKVSVLKRMSFVLGCQTLLRLVSLKMASMIALVTFVSSCGNDFEKLEDILARRAETEKELVMIKNQARLRQQATEAKVRADRDQAAALEQALRQARPRQQAAEAELRIARQQVGLEQALGRARLKQAVALDQALRQARLIAREQALRPMDVAAPWQLSMTEEDEFAVNGAECLICCSSQSFFVYGTCSKVCHKNL